MALTKLQRPPDVAGNSRTDGDEVVAIRLDGGASRFRADKINSATIASAKWTVNAFGLEYMRAFFNTTTERGADPFLIDLALDSAESVEHTAHFVPNTMKVDDIGGGTFAVSAMLEVVRNAVDADYNAAFVALVGSFGLNESLILAGLASLEQLVNVDLPATAPE